MQMHISSALAAAQPAPAPSAFPPAGAPADPAALLRLQGGVPVAVHRGVYADPAVFAAEQDRIFRRVWLYVGHDSEVPNPGDWMLTRLGPDEVILARRGDGGLSLLHNRCSHRGARIVTAPRGHATQLTCAYHAWSFGLDGALTGVPLANGYAAAPVGDARFAVAVVPRVQSYRGFIFASQATDGPGLVEFLGGLASALDNLVDRAPAGTVSAGGGRLHMEYRGNWKLFMENAVDLVHPGYVHASAVGAARADPAAAEAPGVTGQVVQMQLANGLRTAEWDGVGLHAYPGGHLYMGGFYRQGVIAPQREDPVFTAYRAALVARHGEARVREILAVDRFNNLIWPGLSVNSRFQSLRIVQPIAVDRTVVVSQCFRLDGAPEEMHRLALRFLTAASSPASLVAADDLEVFERCQRGFNDQAMSWIDLSRGITTDAAGEGGEVTAKGTSELPMRHQMAAWARWMVA